MLTKTNETKIKKLHALTLYSFMHINILTLLTLKMFLLHTFITDSKYVTLS